MFRINKAFTVVELMVVIVIIAILATIVGVSYRGITDDARNTAVLSDIKSAQETINSEKAFNGRYPSSDDIWDLVSVSRNNDMDYYTDEGQMQYCVSIYNYNNDDFSYYVTNQDEQPVPGYCDDIYGVAYGDGSEVPVADDPFNTDATNGNFGNASDVAVGTYHMCKLDSGKVYCWGYGDMGQLGTGSSDRSDTPVEVGGLLSGKIVTQIAANTNYTCAVAVGAVYCWGYGNTYQLGNGSTSAYSPVAVDMTGALSGKTVVSVSTGDMSACVLTSDNGIYCWGYGGSGAMGNGSSASYNYSPVAVDMTGVLSGKTVTSVSVGNSRACALASGKVYCWGWNSLDGELGDGTTNISLSPVAVGTTGAMAGATLTSMSTSYYSTCALSTTGQIYCWGWNRYGALGNGDTSRYLNPVAVTMTAMSGKTVTSVIGGFHADCAIANSQAYCWGWNMLGQLGVGDTNDRLTPTLVTTNLSGKTVTKVAAGPSVVCAIANAQVICNGKFFFGP